MRMAQKRYLLYKFGMQLKRVSYRSEMQYNQSLLITYFSSGVHRQEVVQAHLECAVFLKRAVEVFIILKSRAKIDRMF